MTLSGGVMTLDDQLELAKRVYPGRKVAVSKYGDGQRVLVEMEGEFKPSLTGNQQYRAQALDCIVAATALSDHLSLHSHDGGKFRITWWQNKELKTTGFCPDILSAAAQALLSQEG